MKKKQISQLKLRSQNHIFSQVFKNIKIEKKEKIDIDFFSMYNFFKESLTNQHFKKTFFLHLNIYF